MMQRCGAPGSTGGVSRHPVTIMDPVNDLLALGWSFQQAGNLTRAEDCYRQAVQAGGSRPDAWFRLGTVCVQLGKLDESVPYFREALRLNPREPETHTGLARALKRLGRLEDAVASFQQAVELNPDSPTTRNGLAVALAELGRLEEAVAGFRHAVRLKPDFAEAHGNLGFALRNLGRLDEALATLRLAIQLKPEGALAYNNLGITLVDLGKLDEAIASFQQSVRLEPEFADAHKNLGIALLLSGNLEQGWPEYEWRWKTKAFASRLGSLTQPRWDGSPLAGRTILLCAEQGLGDSIQFVRYAPLVKQTGGAVVLECQPSLVSLLGRCPGIDQIVPKGSARPRFDVYAPLMSLPCLFKTSLVSIPASVPYLSADSARVSHWKRELGSLPGFKVGIVWRGSPTFETDRLRSIALAQFAPLAELEGIHLVSLQKGAGREQLPGFAARFTVTDLGDRLTDFIETAAAMTALDLIISVDTAPGHLAGALGLPVWVMLPFAPDWRWMLNRSDSPWYPTMRLFRQHKADNWTQVFAELANELKQHL